MKPDFLTKGDKPDPIVALRNKYAKKKPKNALAKAAAGK